MAKRKQRKPAVDLPDGGVPNTSAGYGVFEIFKDYKHAHPILKSLGKNRNNIFSQVPRRPRSKGIVRRRKGKTVEHAGSSEVSILEESRSQCQFTAHPRRPPNTRSKQKAESSDSEVIGQPSLHYCRQLRGLHRGTTAIQKWGKLDTETFERYMESLWRRFTEEKRSVFAYLDSLWFSLYAKEPYKAKVLNWIKRKDIFSKKYVFVPIVQWDHWFLLIFCHFGESPESETKNRCMLLLDSLQKANSQQLKPGIRRFVLDIFKTEERPENEKLISKIPLLIPKVPQQKSGEECGFFVLYYIKLFLESATDNINFSLGYPNFMKEDWFTPEEVECFVNTLDSDFSD